MQSGLKLETPFGELPSTETRPGSAPGLSLALSNVEVVMKDNWQDEFAKLAREQEEDRANQSAREFVQLLNEPKPKRPYTGTWSECT